MNIVAHEEATPGHLRVAPAEFKTQNSASGAAIRNNR